MMKNNALFLFALVLLMVTTSCCHGLPNDTSAVVLESEAVHADADWHRVALEIQERRAADLLCFASHPDECRDALRALNPRYVIVVEKPENINDHYVMQMAALSRTMDADAYADWLWGIVTGYDAASASRMAANSEEPLVVHNCVSDIMELQSAKWFDNYAWVDDHVRARAGEKRGFDSPVNTYTFPFDDELNVLSRFIYDYDPDLIITSTHANYNLLTVPFMSARKSMFVSEGGVIWKQFDGQNTEPLAFTERRKVYFPVGNCLIAGINNDVNSMPPAWIKSANSAAVVGYVVPTWYGRNGWGALKYWLTTPGRYTLSEAVYMNQQDMLAQMNRWNPHFAEVDYPFHTSAEDVVDDASQSEFGLAEQCIRRATHIDTVTNDMVGFLYDRDVLAYYGDPLWNVRLQTLSEENDYTVRVRQRRGEVTVVIRTKDTFSLSRMKGDHFKEEHVGDLPFSLFFPCRLSHPRLAEGQEWDAVVDENFLLIYDPSFEPGHKYEVRILTD